MKKNKQLVPKKRFKEFENSGEWEMIKLKYLSALITKGTTPTDRTEKGNINFIKVENINPKSGEIFSTSKISKEEHNGYLKRSKLHENDILFSIAGTLGRITTIDKKILPANTNQALAIIRLKNGYLYYIKTYLKGKAVIDYIKKNPTVGAQPNLSLEQVGDLNISLPSECEQEKIGLFFEKLDKTIQLQQHKLKKVQSLKSAYLSNMFPKEGEKYPKKRFEGFTESWELVKLSDISNVIGGGTPSTTNPRYWDGEIDWYSPTEIGNSVYTESSRKKITKLGLEKSSANILPKDRTILFTSRAGIGDMAILRNPGATNQGFQSLVLRDGIDTYFIYSMGYLIKEYAEQNASGSTFMEISGKNLEKMSLRIPSNDEQIKIGKFFKNLDKQIDLEEQKLEKLEQLKQAYLNELFV